MTNAFTRPLSPTGVVLALVLILGGMAVGARLMEPAPPADPATAAAVDVQDLFDRASREAQGEQRRARKAAAVRLYCRQASKADCRDLAIATGVLP